MQKFFLAVTSIIVAVGIGNTEAKHSPPSNSWEDYKSFHSKQYESAEHEAYHKTVFEKNAAAVAAHNEMFKNGQVGYSKELNKFADIDPEIFRERNGFKLPEGYVQKPSPLGRKKQVPKSFDWRSKGKVSPVKDQQSCGSCWAFSATGALESQILIKDLPAQSLSEEQVISCDQGEDHGCNGGWYFNAWQYYKEVGGVESELDYPYTSFDGNSGNCSFNSSDIVQTVAGSQYVGDDDDSIMQSLVENGPISVAMDASDWQLASQGIFSCNKTDIDHAILLVGYGTDNGTDYWLLKNSWGADWADDGFFKVARGTYVDCGIHYYPYYPLI